MNTITIPPPSLPAWRDWRDRLAGTAGAAMGPAKVLANLLGYKSSRYIYYWIKAEKPGAPQWLFEALDRRILDFLEAIMRGADPRGKVDPLRLIWSLVVLYLVRVLQRWSGEELEQARVLSCSALQVRIAEVAPWQLQVRSDPEDEKGHQALALHALQLGWASARLSAISYEILRRRGVSP